MMLVVLIAVPFAGGLLAWLAARWSATAARWVSIAAATAGLVMGLVLWARHFGMATTSERWVAEFDASWIAQAGVRLHLGADGLSLIMVLMTFAMTLLALASSAKGVIRRAGLFHLTIMWSATGLCGAFLALDLFVFYFFFELMLVPLYFLVAFWGHEDRVRASLKFLIYTQAAGLLMLVAILGLYFVHGGATGTYTFDLPGLLSTDLPTWTGIILMLGFFVAFAVKLPAFPLHGWLPDAHTQAPTAGSVLLAGVLIKVGAYGMMRFMFPLFPAAAQSFSRIGMGLGVAGIFYGAVLAFAQTDLKRMVAYTSVSHMGFVLVGIFAWNELALQGVVLEIVCHAFSTGGLFVVAGFLDERLGTRDLGRMGGLWSRLPRLGGVTMFLAMSALGLPALGTFVAEFLILLGTFRENRVVAVLASLGLVAATVYALRLVERVFHGPPAPSGTEGRAHARRDLTGREVVTMAFIVIVLLWLGLYPQTLVRTTEQTSGWLLDTTSGNAEAPGVTAPEAAGEGPAGGAEP